MNVGLLYTPVSIFQMTRGALVFFVGIFSVVFLRRRLYLYQCVAYPRIMQILQQNFRWISLALVVFGVTIVGLSGRLVELQTSKETSHGAAETVNVLIGNQPQAPVIYSTDSFHFRCFLHNVCADIVRLTIISWFFY